MHVLQHLFGLDDGSGALYLWWSGIFGDLTIFAAIGGLWFHVNCHQSGCLRIGRHPVGDGKYKVCAKHHPAIDGKITAGDILEHHVAHTLRRVNP